MAEANVLPYEHIVNPATDTVLYLHGFMGCKEDWNEIIERLGGRFSHLAVDLPGHGAEAGHTSAELTDIAFSMHSTTHMIIELLDRLEIPVCYVVGYSMGGRLALYLAVTHSKRVKKAVVESASPGVETSIGRRERVDQDEALALRLENEPLEAFLDDWYARDLFSTIDQRSERFQSLLERRRRSDPKGLARSLRHMGTGVQPSLHTQLRHLDVPILFMAGEKDKKFRELARKMADKCPKGKAVEVIGVGHMTHFEDPHTFSETIQEFFSSK